MTITTVGRLEDCILLAYRTPAERVRELVPRGLELMTHGGFAFWNVVACRVVGMRPAGLPKFAGISFHHVAYRLYVRATTAESGETSGLYFVRSDADSSIIATSGNWMTDFRFHSAQIRRRHEPGALRYDVSGGGEADMSLAVEMTASPALDAAKSCFESKEESARVLTYRPLAFAPADAGGNVVRLAEVFRDERKWEERPVRVVEARFKFLESLGQDELVPERATCVAPVDYRWRVGRRERLVALRPAQLACH